MQLSTFIDAVNQSKVLMGVQKKELLDAPEILPEAYLMHIIEVLQGYDDRARARERKMRKQIEAARERFAQALDAEHVSDEEKHATLEKARKHVGIILRNAPAS